MDNVDKPATGLEILRGTISILTRGGPFTVNVYQDTNPVLLKGMRLPAEAEYTFMNPIDLEHNYVNKPVSCELFFGENGNEGQDISLGVYPIFDLESAHSGSPKTFKIILAVSVDEVLSLSVRDEATKKYFNIAFMDISGIEPPLRVPKPDKPFASFTKENLQAYADKIMNAPPRQGRLPTRGKDLSQKLAISFEEAFHGIVKNFQATSTRPCPVCVGSGLRPGKAMTKCPICDGTGTKREEHKTEKGPEYRFSTCPNCHGNGLINTFPCEECNGNGWLKSTRPITLQIPACIDYGAEICLLQQGEPGRDGGPPGHLRISIQVTPHPLFSRVGRELLISLPVSVEFARRGGSLRVPDIERGNSFMVDLPAGTKDNSFLQAFKSDDYSLTACIKTYRPGFLFAFPQIKEHLKEIHDLLVGAELEVTGESSGVQGHSEDKAISAVQIAKTERFPQQPDFYIQRGLLYANKHDRMHAMADINKALELDPDCAEAYDMRAAEHGLHKDFTKALTDEEKALELDPRNVSYLFHQGVIHEYLNDLEKARAAYDTALEIDSTCIDAYARRGQLAVTRGDLQSAIADFSRILEIAPDNNEALGNRSLAYSALKEFDLAIADMDRFLERHPENSNGYNNRGFVYLQKNDLNKALEDYDRALELNFKMVTARVYRAKTLLLLRQFAKAIEDLDQAIALNPQELYPLFLLGQAYQGMGEKKHAADAYQRYLNSSHSLELCREARMHLEELGINAR